MDTPLVINIDTGVITFQNEENDNQCNCRRISRENALKIERGELDVKVVIAAIKKHIAAHEEFDFDQFTKDRAKLNVRSSALAPSKREEVLKDRSGEEISDEEIAAAKGEGKNIVENSVDAAFAEIAKRNKGKGKGKKIKSTEPEDTGISAADLIGGMKE